MKKVANALIDFHAAMETGVDTAYKAYETTEMLDDIEKMAVWEALQQHSKVRSWLKKIGEEHRRMHAK